MAADKVAGGTKPGFGARTRRYYGEVVSELKRCSWPTRSDLVAQTKVVLGLLVIIGIFLFLSDLLFSLVFRVILRTLGGQSE